MSAAVKPFELTNYYQTWEKYFKEEGEDPELRHYPNEAQLKIELPFRGIVQGPSGSMKTTVMMNIVFGIGKWNRIVVLAKNLDEKLYRGLKKKVAEIEKKAKQRILLMIDKVSDLPPIDAFRADENSLLIVDDFVADGAKELKPISEMWLRGRKNGVSMCFLSQSYFDVPKLVRKNSDYVFCKRQGNAKDFQRISREYAMGIDWREMEKLYQYAIDGNPLNFFLIDRNNSDPKLRFRRNFEPIDTNKFGITTTQSKWTEQADDSDDEQEEKEKPQKVKHNPEKCAAKTVKGTQCSIRATLGEFCKRHTPK